MNIIKQVKRSSLFKKLAKNLFFLLLIFILPIGHFLYSTVAIPRKQGFVDVEISKGQTLDQIIKYLSDSQLISKPFYFKILAILMGRESHLRAGSYTIPKNTSIYEIIKILTESNGAFKVSVTIPEGLPIAKINERLGKIIKRPVNLQNVQVWHFKEEFEFLSEIPGDKTLEGFLFPDTYNINKYDSDYELAYRMLDNFNRKLNDSLRQEIKSQNKSVYSVITMASLIEREIPDERDSERNVASGILWKRLDVGMPLQVDATLLYIKNYSSPVTSADLKIDSPYNTYLYKGLPAGPIANPGLDAIESAIYPQESAYWYYLSKPTGETVFSKTLAEHETARNKYLR